MYPICFSGAPPSNPCTFNTQLLEKDRKIRTKGKVTVVSQKGDSLTGVGFESDDKLENWVLLSDVKTVIQDLQIEQDSSQADSVQEAEKTEESSQKE